MFVFYKRHEDCLRRAFTADRRRSKPIRRALCTDPRRSAFIRGKEVLCLATLKQRRKAYLPALFWPAGSQEPAASSSFYLSSWQQLDETCPHAVCCLCALERRQEFLREILLQMEILRSLRLVDL